MSVKENKPTGFWIRLLSRLLDIFIFSAASICTAFLLIKKNNNIWDFKFPVFFYLWIFITILLIILVFFLPLLFGNKTLGMFIFRIKVIFKKENKFKSVFLREFVFSIGWIFSILTFSIVINHTMFSKVASYKKIIFSTFENLRIGIVSTLSSFVVFLQLVFAISIIIRKEKGAIHDSLSSSKTVWINKFVETKEKPSIKNIGFKPRLVKQEYIEWIK